MSTILHLIGFFGTKKLINCKIFESVLDPGGKLEQCFHVSCSSELTYQLTVGKDEEPLTVSGYALATLKLPVTYITYLFYLLSGFMSKGTFT